MLISDSANTLETTILGSVVDDVQDHHLAGTAPDDVSPSARPGEQATTQNSKIANQDSVDGQFLSAFRYAPSGMALVTPDGNWIEVNHTLCEIIGYREQELLGANLKAITHPDDLATDLGYIRKIVAGEIDHYKLEKRYIHKLGQIVWVELTVTPHRDAHGSCDYFIFQVMDISERIRSEETRKAREAAEHASKAKSEFLSRMSHELRTPMNAMLGFAQLLEMDDLTRAQRESTGHILRAGRHLLNLINEVLDIARIEEGRLSLSVEPIPVREVLSESLELMQPLAAQQGMLLRADVKWLGDRHVHADRQRLHQVLVNLLSNAIKYNRGGGTVRLTCKELASKHLRVAVSDNGPGIAADMMARLFNPFDRLGIERGSIEGTGLGLALSKRLTEAMGGVIGVDSELGRGSTFWIDLPLVESQMERFERTGTSPLTSSLVTDGLSLRKILYIEDNLSNLRLADRILELRPDVKLLPATTGQRGLEIARQRRPDLILLDLHLPDMSGEEVLEQLLAWPETCEVPVVILSADATQKQIDHLMEAGAYTYLTKPLNVKRFLNVLEETLYPF